MLSDDEEDRVDWAQTVCRVVAMTKMTLPQSDFDYLAYRALFLARIVLGEHSHPEGNSLICRALTLREQVDRR